MALLGITFAFAQSVATLTRIDLGLDLDSVATFSVTTPPGRWTSQADWDPIAEALDAIPGVSSMASSSPALLGGSTMNFPVSVRGVEAEPLPVGTYQISPDFFRMFGIELLAGRELNDTDSGLSAAIVSQRFVERLGLTRDDVLGAPSTRFGPGTGVVGAVADRVGRITEEIEPRMSTGGAPRTTFAALAARVCERPARLPLADPTWGREHETMEQQFRDSIAIQRRCRSRPGVRQLATALAALGLYGVLGTPPRALAEIGLRLALGAPAARIGGMVLRQVAGMAAIGVVLGALAAWGLGLAAQSLLFGVEAGDPLALAAAAALLTVVMLGAAYIPVRRASRVDPMNVLRYE
jgi:hypothetical protein